MGEGEFALVLYICPPTQTLILHEIHNHDDLSSYLKNNSFVEHLLQEINGARVDTKLRGIKATHITSGNIGENNGGSHWMRLQPFCVHVFMNTLDDGAKH